MKNNTNKTIKQMVLAAGVAMVMGTVSAAVVPGLPSGMFEANGAEFSNTGNGANAITNINDILASVGDTSGSNIDNTKFWQSFVDDQKTQTFDYHAAKGFIDELVFTVTGEAYGAIVHEGALGWHDASTVLHATAFNTQGHRMKVSEVFVTEASLVSRAATLAEVEFDAGISVGQVKTAAVIVDGVTTVEAVLYTLVDVEAASSFNVGDVRTGNMLDGKIKLTGQKAMELLGALNFTGGSTSILQSSDFGTYGCAVNGTSPLVFSSANCSTDVADNEDTNIANTNIGLTGATTAITAPTDTTGVSAIVLANGFTNKVTDARLNEGAFINANLLIKEISKQLKNGYILNVAAATSAVSGIIGQHNAFLGASIVDTAKGIKSVIKSMGLQVAAAEVGMGASLACTSNSNMIDSKACVAIGSKFTDIITDIEALQGSKTSAQMAASYNEALSVIDGFADDLIAFNDSSVAGNYGDGSSSFGHINDQFGTITVVANDDDDDTTDTFYESLVRNDAEFGGTGNPIGMDQWTVEAELDVGTDFDGMFDIDGDLTTTGDQVELH